MIIPMTESRYVNLDKNFKKLNCPEQIKKNIVYNMRCFDHFLDYPDDAPEEEKEIIKKLVTIS